MSRRPFLLGAALLAAAGLRAADEGTSSAHLLTESMTARASGLAEAGTAMVGDLGVLSFNPAGLPFMKRSELTARFQGAPGNVTSGVLGYGRRVGAAAVGVSAAYLDAGTIDLAFTGGQRYSRRAQQDFAGQVGIGFPLFDGVTAGVGARMIRSTLVEDFKASAVAGDAGLTVRMPVRGWLLAASARNIGGDLTYRNVGDPLPSEARVGTSYSLAKGDRTVSDVPSGEWYMRDEEETPIFTAFLDGVRRRSGAMGGAAGFEWTQWPKAAFRAGYGWGEDGTGLTLGFGLNLIKFSLDYSWRFVDNLSDAHRLSFSLYWE
jgi:hypothetical protein